MKEAERAATNVVDVDGSYLHRKYKALAEAEQEVADHLILFVQFLDGGL